MTNDGTPQWGQPEQQPQQQYAQQQYAQQQYAQQYAQPYPMYATPAPVPVDPDGAPPLWAPWYGIGFLDAFTRFFKKYARFDGRASRSEYWYWVLANAIVTIVLIGGFYAIIFATVVGSERVDADGNTVGGSAPSPFAFVLLGLWFLWWLATLVPSIALGWRRVHDAGMPGAVWLVGLFVSVAAIVLGCLPSNPAGAQYDRPDLG